MNYMQLLIPALVLSMPIVGIIAILRGIVCLFCCKRAKHNMYLFLTCLCVLLMVLVLCAVVVIIFGYGVAHTGKDAATDLIVLAITVIPTYGVAVGIWLAFRAMEKRLNYSGS
jgi:hypothetical protein